MKILDVPQSVLDLLAVAAGENATAWGRPDPIEHDLLPVMSIDPDMLPDAIRDWVTDISYRMQCPIDFVAVAALSMFGSIIGSACGIRPKQRDNWCEVPNLWGAVVARPGRLKSPAIAAAMRPLAVLDREAQLAYEAELQLHNVRRLTRKTQLELKKKALGKANAQLGDDDLKALAELAADQEEPVCRRYVTNDTTFEMLGEILSENPRGMLVQHDELMGLLDGFTRTGREGEKSFYLAAWNGQSMHRVDRIGRGSLVIERLCATLFGGIQPEKLERYLFDTQLASGNDGFIQRFQLAVFPDDLPRDLVVDETANSAAEDRVVRLGRALANADFVAWGAAQDQDGRLPYFRYQPGRAQKNFVKWLECLLGRIRAEDSPLMQEHLSKYRKLVPALSLIFHLIEQADRYERAPGDKAGRGISAATLAMALKWAAYLETHARRIYGMSTDYALIAAQALAKKIKAGELPDGFSERDVQRKEWAALREPEVVKEALKELETANWIRRIDTRPKGLGRPPSPKYEINPAVLSGAIVAPAPTKPTKRRRQGPGR